MFRVHRPTIGGWLAIGNCATWVILLGGSRLIPEPLPEWLAISISSIFLFLSLPIAFPFILPSLDDYRPTYEGQLMIAVLIGINSFLWGYGIEYALRWTGFVS